ncbi:MAG: CDP-glycerol glycerophosphotransferase family protein [Candidatus Harrisonbacteria bacterium]|nr:CDP-glycerol glycerophosphotransferase family protein [Candidatus Harrisonbacteria bacterium]
MHPQPAKTIFLTSFHVLISRNILSTPILKMLTDKGVQIVILVPDYKKEFFEKNFSGPNIIIEGIEAYGFSKSFIGLFFKRLSRVILDTDTVRIRMKYKLVVERKFIYYFLFFVPAKILGKSKTVISLIRFLDYKLRSKPGYFLDLFNRYHPDLIVATDVNNENDVALLQDAKAKKMPTAAIVRSWDNLTNFLMRSTPDWLVVANEIMKSQVITYHGLRAENVLVTGMPHYDRYIRGATMSRKEFFDSIDADQRKKLILYVPVADYRVKENDIDSYIIRLLSSLDVNTLVRFPPAATVAVDKTQFPENVIFDEPGVRFGGKGDSEMTKEDDDGLINILSYSDVVVSGPGTMNIDAAIFDKPIVLVNLYPTQRIQLEGIKEYGYTHIQNILKTGGIRMATNKEELFDFINLYFKNPSLDADGRRRITREQCYKLDGRSSERVTNHILRFLSENEIIA